MRIHMRPGHPEYRERLSEYIGYIMKMRNSITILLAVTAAAILVSGCAENPLENLFSQFKKQETPVMDTEYGDNFVEIYNEGTEPSDSTEGELLIYEDSGDDETSSVMEHGTEEGAVTIIHNDQAASVTDGSTASANTAADAAESTACNETLPTEAVTTTVADTEGTTTDSTDQSESSAPGFETETESDITDSGAEGPAAIALSSYIAPLEAAGQHWSMSYENLSTGDTYAYQEDDQMQAASVIKLFIMATAYRYMCYPESEEDHIAFGESYEGELRETLESMIQVSDNDAANLLVERLGEGDFDTGAKIVNDYCIELGCTATSIGRRFLEENPTGDNYTSAADVRRLLSMIYHGTLINEEASGKMLDILKGQTRTEKIPAGLPEGFTCANKTGEIAEGYGLGCIENDAAICMAPEGEGEGFILVVMSNDLSGTNETARQAITQIASLSADWYLQSR